MDRVFAASVVLGCVVLLVRLALGETRRERLALAWRRWQARRRPGGLPGTWLGSRSQRDAEKIAREAIRRARERAAGEWDGNVYRPTSFRRRKGNKNVH